MENIKKSLEVLAKVANHRAVINDFARTKLTDFILKNLRWTGIFLCEQIYWSRLSRTLNDIKNNIDDIEIISHKNNDVIKGFSKENFNNRTLYKVAVV